MFNAIEALLTEENELKSELDLLNKNWMLAKASGAFRECVKIDHLCAALERDMIALNTEIEAVWTMLDSHIGYLEDEAADIDNVRAAAMDAGDKYTFFTALDTLGAIETDRLDAVWSQIWIENAAQPKSDFFLALV